MANKIIFVQQIDRLKSNFGERAFGREKVEIIWDEVKFLSDADLISLTTDLIADSRFSPTRKEFREKIAERRMVKYDHEKKERTRQIKNHGSLPADIVGKGMIFLGKLVNGIIPQESYQKFDSALRASQKSCRYCNGSGYVFAKERDSQYDNFSFRCICALGRDIEENLPLWSADFAEKYQFHT